MSSESVSPNELLEQRLLAVLISSPGFRLTSTQLCEKLLAGSQRSGQRLRQEEMEHVVAEASLEDWISSDPRTGELTLTPKGELNSSIVLSSYICLLQRCNTI